MAGSLETVVLVEDNPSHARLITRALEQSTQVDRVIHLSDGEMALDYFFRRGPFENEETVVPSVVLLDLRLPKLDGLEVLRQLKANEATRRIPVVVLTTSGSREDLDAAYDGFVNSYLVKPPAFQDLVELMGEVRTYWAVLNKQPGGKE